MNTLEKIRKARILEVKVGAVTFTGTRATLEQALLYNDGKFSDAEVCRRHINGWSGVKESDLIEGGSDVEVDFSRALFDEVIGEKAEWWPEIAPVIIEDALSRLTKRSANTKKSKTG